MRKELQKMEEARDIFVGVFVRHGIKNGYKGPEKTILLKDIKNAEGKIVSDHLWFNLTKGFEKVGLQEGEAVQFNARVKQYEKGYKGYREDVDCPVECDYKLSYPTKIKKIDN